jgi:hypothetical protein
LKFVKLLVEPRIIWLSDVDVLFAAVVCGGSDDE